MRKMERFTRGFCESGVEILSSPEKSIAEPPQGSFARRIALWLVMFGPVMCAAGLAYHAMWRSVQWARFSELTAVGAAALILAELARRLGIRQIASSLALIWLAALTYFVGPASIFAVLLLAGSSIAIGTLILGSDDADCAVALPVGLVVIAGCVGWLLPAPIHFRAVYLCAGIGVVAIRWRVLRLAARNGLCAFNDSVAAAPKLAAAAMMLLGLTLTAAWLPTMQGDDLGYHLGLPSQLQRNGFYALDPTPQIWALAPWLGDVVQGIAQVVAGTEARGAVDFLWLALCSAALGRLSFALRPDVRVGWLVVALFASQPMLGLLVSGMQTELPAAALMVVMSLLIVDRKHEKSLREKSHRGKYLAVCILAAGLFALKFSQAVSAVVILIYAFVHGKKLIEARRLPICLLAFLLVAGSSYLYAWHISGNPMLPLFNQIFKSPVMPFHQLDDTRWHAGLSPLLPWRVTFDTPHYLEAQPGGYGFTLVMLMGAWLVALADRRTRGPALMASAVLIIPMLPFQYARYSFPGLVLLLPMLVIAGDSAAGGRRFACVVFATCALNLAFQANAPWPMGTVARKRLLFSRGDQDAVFLRFAPERLLIAEVRKRDSSNSIVLSIDPKMANVAELAGRGRTVSWYCPSLESARIAADADPRGSQWRDLIDASRASWLLLRTDDLNDAQRAALMSGQGQRVYSVGDSELWSWNGSRASGTETR